jgi:crotonobetainyl-CoA:carnitine CoA-transferase CaiB-like acyl-CoA transferase
MSDDRGGINESAQRAPRALPLSGLRVLDLGRYIAAPWSTQMLGDLGADILKIERPESGDQMRQYGPPFLRTAAGEDTKESSYFLCANRNKRSVAVDISQAEGQDLIRRLAATADIFIENFKVGDLARFGLDYDGIRTVRPDIIYCSITAFGQTGPYAARPGLDSVFQAMGGLMSVTGEPDGPPQKVGVTIVDVITGLYATIAIQAAIRHREQTGAGQHIDMALLDAAVAVMSHRAQDYLLTNDVPQRSGTKTLGSAPAQVFKCRDGDINIQAGDQPAFESLCDILKLRELTCDIRFRARADRWRNRAMLLPIIEAAIADWSQRDLYAELVARGVVSAPIYSLDQTFSDPQVVFREMRRVVRHAAGADVPIIANPIRFSATPIEHYDAPPLLGEHTSEILIGCGLTPSEIEDLARRGVVGVAPNSNRVRG